MTLFAFYLTKVYKSRASTASTNRTYHKIRFRTDWLTSAFVTMLYLSGIIIDEMELTRFFKKYESPGDQVGHFISFHIISYSIYKIVYGISIGSLFSIPPTKKKLFQHSTHCWLSRHTPPFSAHQTAGNSHTSRHAKRPKTSENLWSSLFGEDLKGSKRLVPTLCKDKKLDDLSAAWSCTEDDSKLHQWSPADPCFIQFLLQ